MINFIIFLVIGLIAGAITDMLFKSKSFGILGHLVIGVIGGVLGGYLFGLLGLDFDGFIGSIFTAIVGALVLLTVIQFAEKQFAN